MSELIKFIVRLPNAQDYPCCPIIFPVIPPSHASTKLSFTSLRPGHRVWARPRKRSGSRTGSEAWILLDPGCPMAEVFCPSGCFYTRIGSNGTTPLQGLLVFSISNFLKYLCKWCKVTMCQLHAQLILVGSARPLGPCQQLRMLSFPDICRRWLSTMLLPSPSSGA